VVYIATDSPTSVAMERLMMETNLLGYSVRLFDSFRWLFDLDCSIEQYIPFIEQVVLCHSRSFLSTIGSSFSDGVLLFRKHMNMDGIEQELNLFDCQSQLKASPYYQHC
jgi:hypothetical protein